MQNISDNCLKDKKNGIIIRILSVYPETLHKDCSRLCINFIIMNNDCHVYGENTLMYETKNTVFEKYLQEIMDKNSFEKMLDMKTQEVLTRLHFIECYTLSDYIKNFIKIFQQNNFSVDDFFLTLYDKDFHRLFSSSKENGCLFRFFVKEFTRPYNSRFLYVFHDMGEEYLGKGYCDYGNALLFFKDVLNNKEAKERFLEIFHSSNQ